MRRWQSLRFFALLSKVFAIYESQKAQKIRLFQRRSVGYDPAGLVNYSVKSLVIFCFSLFHKQNFILMKKKPRKQKKRELKKALESPQHLEMAIIHPHAGAADIGSKEHYICVGLNRAQDVRTFGCSTDELNKACDWLEERDVTSFAMESTGHYWYALHDMLTRRGKIEVILVNGRFSKNISGRKSDLMDSEWLYKLHSFGLLRGSFLTDAITNEVKRLSRHRGTLVRESVRHLARIGKNFRQMNIVLDSVLSSFKTVSGRRIIEAVIAGERDPNKLADLANKTVKASREKLVAALTGTWQESCLFQIKQCYEAYLLFNRQIGALDLEINALLAKSVTDTEGVYQPYAVTEKPVETVAEPTASATPAPLIYVKDDAFKQKAGGIAKATYRLPINRVKRDHHTHEIGFDIQGYGYKLWGTDLFAIPGVGRESVLVLISEIGALKNWEKFPTAGHFAAWLGLLPNNRISGGKVLSNHRIRHDNRVSAALRNAAASLIKDAVKKTTALHRFGMRIMHKKGKTAAVVALASKIAKIIWYMITRQEPFKQPTAAEYEEQKRQITVRKIQKQINQMNITAEEISIVV
jgi:transposase